MPATVALDPLVAGQGGPRQRNPFNLRQEVQRRGTRLPLPPPPPLRLPEPPLLPLAQEGRP